MILFENISRESKFYCVKTASTIRPLSFGLSKLGLRGEGSLKDILTGFVCFSPYIDGPLN
jgi:hypothetical protein